MFFQWKNYYKKLLKNIYFFKPIETFLKGNSKILTTFIDTK